MTSSMFLYDREYFTVWSLAASELTPWKDQRVEKEIVGNLNGKGCKAEKLNIAHSLCHVLKVVTLTLTQQGSIPEMWDQHYE